MTLVQKQNYRDRRQIIGYQGLGERNVDYKEALKKFGDGSDKTVLCDEL